MDIDAMEESARIYYLAEQAADSGDLDTSERLYRESLTVLDHWKSHNMLARVLLRLGKTEEADEHFRLGYVGHVRNDRVATDYAERLIVNGNEAEAKRVLNEVLERNDSYMPARRLLDGMSSSRS